MPEGAAKLPQVLAVDDSPIVLEMVRRILKDDYQVLLADNAVEALSKIYHEPISVLLLDVSMPQIDGLELCRTVRNLPQFRNLPIVMITSRDKAFDRVQGRMAGATEYLTKPFEAQQLKQIVDRLTRSTESPAGSVA
ncbi:PleD family two-component system response regulator [Geitlerinema sp. PCC 7407]|jgi:CheY-like chemotaxis protein|uniref:response regulator n=1 Tax=Geitlerinema sp. PCC 7407 TaxID=1173025 RepID=UPI00029F8F57|nr:response regulator [Geitlerinema sp. PCC 7407]AFY68158.1 response regulator receiver protein [Geitlerinema sp. PCC 7407]